MKKLLVFHFLFFLAINGLFGVNNEENSISGWKAGVAREVITPRESMWMAGYAARNKPSEGTLHDLWANALALEDAAGERAVLVTTDLIGFNSFMSGRIKARIYSKYNLSDRQIILSASHTHTGPALQRAPEDYLGLEGNTGQHSDLHRERIRMYSEYIEDQVVELVGRALSSMEPVRIYSGNGVERFAVNRRTNTESGLRPNTQLAGPVDHSVPVMKIEKLSGGLMSVVFGYACHTTTLSFYQWSGDYAGFAQIELEKKYPGTTAMFFAGTGADINPLPRRTVGLARQYGTSLASAVEAVLSEPMRELSASLFTAYSEIDLAFRDQSPTRGDLMKIIEPDSGYPDWLKDRAKVHIAQLDQGIELITSYPYPVQFWKIGEQKMAILAGEVVVDYSLKLKQIFGPDLFVMAYANDMPGYIPSTRVLSEGGYEGDRSPVFTTPWAPDIEMKIIMEVVRLSEKAGN